MTNTHCSKHSGHEEKMIGIDKQVSSLNRLLGILITVLIVVNGGLFAMLITMSNTLTKVDTKLSMYDKVFEDTIKLKQADKIEKTTFNIKEKI
jgi:hypothetical protein